jgi:hypothetical protein
MRVDQREFTDKSYVIMVADQGAEENALENLGGPGSLVTGEILSGGNGEVYLQIPYAATPQEWFVDVFVGDPAKMRVHHKNVNRAACEYSKIESPVVFDSLMRARLQSFDLCPDCFEKVPEKKERRI